MKQRYNFLLKEFILFLWRKVFKRLDYNWKEYPSRIDIIKKIIINKNYQSYLEIGCDNDESFSQIPLATR